MIEMYTAIFLFGIGAYLNENMKKPVEVKVSAPVKKTTENVYNTKIKEKVDELSNQYSDEIKQKCEHVVPRSFTDFLDPETKAMYEETKRLQNSGPTADESMAEGEEQFVSPLTGKPMLKENFMIATISIYTYFSFLTI